MSLIVRKIFEILRSVKVYFYYTGRPKSINPISFFRAKRNRDALRYIKKIDKGQLWRLIEETRDISGSTGCEHSDYYRIWTLLHKLQIKNVLELGSGISTVVFAYYAMKTNSTVSITSVEENDFYHEQIIKIFPDELLPYVNFVRLDRKEYMDEKLSIHHCYYEGLPKIKYDFVLIDGPTDRATFNDKSLPKCYNSDLLNVVRENGDGFPVTALLDQRIFTLRALRSKIRNGRKRFLYDSTYKSGLIRGLRSDELIP